MLALTAPAPVKLAILAAAVAIFGKLGAPADRPLIDRAVTGSRAEKLTSDVVIRALGSLGLAAINQAVGKDPKTAIEFKAPITRDGPGWRADLDLPVRRDRGGSDGPARQARLGAAPPARLRVARD